MTAWDPERLAELLRAVPAPPTEVPERRAAVAVVLCPGPETDVLLMTRARRPDDPWSGQVSLPGGHREPDDADLVATAVRETLEEVGVDLDAHAELLGALPPRAARARGKVLPMDVSPFVFAASTRVEPTPSEEAADAFWFPLARAARGELDDRHRYEHEGRTLLLPSWRFEQRVVWGMTHRILSDLSELAGG